MARPGKSRIEDDPSQLLINWSAPKPAATSAPARPDVAAPVPLVQVLPWDFKTTFPQPTDAAIDNGVLDETDREAENLQSLHENYARQCLATLAALDKVMDARRKGVDPGTGNKPRTHASRERLRKYLAEEPARLEHTFDVLIDTYGEAFGQEAADAFRKAIRAWHSEIEVSDRIPAKTPKAKSAQRRIIARFPVPTPLPAAVAAYNFGIKEGKPIRPGADEVRAITETHAQKIVELMDELRSAPQVKIKCLREQIQAEVAKYAGDFGEDAAKQLEAYTRRRDAVDHGHVKGRSR